MDGTSVVTHRVIEAVTEDGELYWRTQGDANNAADAVLVPAENLVGVYIRSFSGVGNVAMFMQSRGGLVVCVVIPIFLLVLYDLPRRRRYERGRRQDTDELLAELEELRRLKKEDGGDGSDRSGPEDG